MPNWCSCDLAVLGKTAEQVEAVIAFVASDVKDFDFEKIIPYPQEYRQMDDAFEAWWKQPSEERQKTEAPKDGYNSGGYQWCIENWGTKWNACDVVMEIRPLSAPWAVYHFNTAWAPPLPIIVKLKEVFPNVKFDLRFYEAGMGFAGKFDGKNYTERKYRGNRGG